MKNINNKGFSIGSLFAYLLIFFIALFIVVVLVNKINTPISSNSDTEEKEEIATSVDGKQ